MGLSVLTEEENTIRDAIHQLVRDTIAKTSAEFDRTQTFPRVNMELLGKQGYLGMIVDPKWGGGVRPSIWLSNRKCSNRSTLT